jgi:mRNA interferase RelE/StbE
MSRYQVKISPAALKGMRKLPIGVRRRIDQVIVSLADEPRPHGCKRLAGVDLYAVGVGDYRVLYTVDDQGRIVVVVLAGHCKDVYRR